MANGYGILWPQGKAMNWLVKVLNRVNTAMEVTSQTSHRRKAGKRYALKLTVLKGFG